LLLLERIIINIQELIVFRHTVILFLENMKKNIIPFFAALCLFLSAIEYAIPKPLPFLRLGLANLPILLALSVLNFRQIFFLIVLKTIGQGILSGTLFSYVFLFSVVGSFASCFGMMLMHFCFIKKSQKPLISFVGISVVGALCNNFAQLIVAKYVLFGNASYLIAPILLISGFVSGLLLGFFANIFSKQSKWYKSICTITKTY